MQHKVAKDLRNMGWKILRVKEGIYYAKQDSKLQCRTENLEEIIPLLVDYYVGFLLEYENSVYSSLLRERVSECITKEFLENFDDIADGRMDTYDFSSRPKGDIPEHRMHTSDWLVAVPSWRIMPYVPTLNPIRRWFKGLSLCVFVKTVSYGSTNAPSMPPIRFSLKGSREYTLSKEIKSFSKYYGVPAFPKLDKGNVGLVVFSGIKRGEELELKLEDLRTKRELKICIETL